MKFETGGSPFSDNMHHCRLKRSTPRVTPDIQHTKKKCQFVEFPEECDGNQTSDTRTLLRKWRVTFQWLLSFDCDVLNRSFTRFKIGWMYRSIFFNSMEDYVINQKFKKRTLLGRIRSEFQ